MSAISGVGTILQKWNSNPDSSSGGAWQKIAQVVSIDGPGMSRETIDTTTLDNEDGYRTFISSLRDAGEVSLTLNYTRDEYEKMKNDFESDIAQNYEIVLPDNENTSIEFEGLVTELPLSITADDKITCDVTIKITGKAETESGSGS